MERLLFATAPCGTQTIRYYLLEEERADEFFTDGEGGTGAANPAGTDYGLLVTMGAEEAAVPALTPIRSRAQELLERMARGTVTPVAVRDVVDDWLLE